MKAVVLAKSATDALRQLDWIARRSRPLPIRVVAPARDVEAIAASGHVAPDAILAYRPAASPLVWLRLALFLGFSPALVACTGSYGSPGIKLLALALRGRILLFNGDPEPAELTAARFLRLAWLTLGRREGDVCLVGAATRPQLAAILADIRTRLPHRRVHLLAPRDSLDLAADSAEPLSAAAIARVSRSRARFARIVLPLAGPGFVRYKLLAWFAPLGYREIYNDNLDCYPARDLGSAIKHCVRHFLAVPRAVCVAGTAPEPRLRAIVADIRLRQPGVMCTALLPARLSAAAALFDDAVIFRPSSLRSWTALAGRIFGPRRAGYLVLPATREGFNGWKLFFWFLPLGRRLFYNENNDCRAARQQGMLFSHLAWRMNGVPNRIVVLGSASSERLAHITADARRRHPGAPCHGLLPASRAGSAHLFDEVTLLSWSSLRAWAAVWSAMFGRRRAGWFVVPATREGHRLLKAAFWFLPLGRREIYNENYDFYSPRQVSLLARHFLWRLRSPFIGDRIWRRLTARPPRITVLGSASGLYLKAVVADLRRRYPGMPIHGLLLPRTVRAAAPLFDSWTLFAPLSGEFWRVVLALAAGRRRSGHLVMPWTHERANLVKVLGFCLPLGLRRVYNENADSYLCRDVRLMVQHARWRLRHRIFYQGLAETRGRWWPLHVLHLAAYPFRLLLGAALFIFVRARVALSTVRPAPAESRADALVIQREPRAGQ